MAEDIGPLLREIAAALQTTMERMPWVAGRCKALECLCLALLETHPDRPAALAAFDRMCEGQVVRTLFGDEPDWIGSHFDEQRDKLRDIIDRASGAERPGNP